MTNDQHRLRREPAMPSRVRDTRSGVRLCVLILAGLGAAQVKAEPSPGLPHLIPQPRESVVGKEVGVSTVRVAVPGHDAEDVFAGKTLVESLRERGVGASTGSEEAKLTVTLLRRNTLAAAATLAAVHMSFVPEMHEEGYILTVHDRQATVVAETSSGIFYGVQTLRQLVTGNGAHAMLQTGTFRDWPAVKYRGIHDDLSRGPFPTLAFQKHQIETFAAYKINLYSPYFEHTLRYDLDPLAAPPGGSLSRSEARELVAFASKYHVTILPEQEAFGHLHHVLEYESYADLAENPHGYVLAPGQPQTQELIKSWFTQIAEDFPGPFFHIGADETSELGRGRTRQEVEKQGLGHVYADFLAQIHETLKPLGRRLLFWGDVAGSDPSAIDRLPKDMIAIPWIYWHQDDYDKNILPFKKAGMETWIAPGDANWNVVYPLGKTALDNIQGFVESGQRLGSSGVLTTVWNDDGEGLFNLDWFGVLFGAAASWQPGRSSIEAYQAAFGQDFYGDTTGKVDEAQREIMAAEESIDVSDEAFWIDPWSNRGRVIAAKLRPHLHEARLHAERALKSILDVRASNPALREPAALDGMELGVRRIDFIGMKFQLADEIAAAYTHAYELQDDPVHKSDVQELLESVSSMNGRCQDLRDGYSLLKTLYQKAWQAENREYWIDNVLVRYDLSIQLWERRGEEMQQATQNRRSGQRLPLPEQMSLPKAPATP